jgi:hypothetical protein
MNYPITPDEFTKGLPKLTNDPLPIKPPFVFNGMSARVFPLRAHLGMLQRVCDGYLNFVPPEAGYFRVPVPYVYVMLLDYGQVAESVARIGWFAQTEVFFLVPLEWYKFEGGRWVFHDWAVITPYVFVNDDFSVPLGRTVFGFPKVLARVMQTNSAWIKDTSAPVTLARIETGVFPQTYSGAEIQNRVLLEVERSTISNLRVPLDAMSSVMPWSIASHLAQAMAGFSRDATWLAQSMRISPVNPMADPGVFQAMLSRVAPWFAPGGKGFVQNSLNLKQFRRSEHPTQICYQALTNGRMETMAFNGAGLLGEYQVMLGDLSGGHTVKLYEYASLPLIRTLGLEIERDWQAPDCRVAELKPVLPFWLDVDIKYDQGDNLAWRTDDGIWRDGSGAEFKSQTLAPGMSAPGVETPDFNSTVTTVIDDIAGPFELSDTTVRVLPLLAEKKTLQAFLDKFMNSPLQDPIQSEGGEEEHIRFRVWQRDLQPTESKAVDHEGVAYVYLMATSFGSIMSTTNNVGDWTKYQLSFMIPVRFERLVPNKRQVTQGQQEKEWELVSVGLVPAFSFVDNCTAAIARLEVQGFEATVANFFKPESVWLSEEVELSANPHQTLLRLDTEVWPAFGQGQQATVQPIIEICQADPDAGLGDAPDAPWRWAQKLRNELFAKKKTKEDHPKDLQVGRALAMELLANQMPFNAFSLKQFRDARDPAKACYQSLVRVPRQIKELVDLREIEETLVVTIHSFPSLDIVGLLGLVASALPVSGSGIVNTAQAIRPFFLHGTLFEPLAERLAFRAGTKVWTLDSQTTFATVLNDEQKAPSIAVDLLAESLQDMVDPCHLRALMYQATQRIGLTAEQRARRGAPKITKAAAREALTRIDPQVVIECILSREWGNIDKNARWRSGRRELVRQLSALPVTGKTSPFAESALYRYLNNQLAVAPGSVASPVHPDDEYHRSLKSSIEGLEKKQRECKTPSERWRNAIQAAILRQEQFMRVRVAMEDAVSVLASAAILQEDRLKKLYRELDCEVPTTADLAQLCIKLQGTLREISLLPIQGQAGRQDYAHAPLGHNDLNTRIAADQARLGELAAALLQQMESKQQGDTRDEQQAMLLKWSLDHAKDFQPIVDLARELCYAQDNAFLDKFSRAYQKPDFCIRRDSVCRSCDQLLPMALSWDSNWYYGRQVSQPSTNAKAAPAPAEGNGVTKGVRKRTRV